MSTTVRKTKRKTKRKSKSKHSNTHSKHSNTHSKNKSPKPTKKSPKQKTKVKDIAALFGSTISAKKVKTRSIGTKRRRNSETLRIHKRKLKNVKHSNNNSNDTNNPFDITLKSTPQTPKQTPDIQPINIINLPPKMDDYSPYVHTAEIQHDYNINYDNDNDNDSDDMSDCIKETYGHWRQWSQSSFLSSISVLDLEIEQDMDMDMDMNIEPIRFRGDRDDENDSVRGSVCDARSSICDDIDRDSVIISEEDSNSNSNNVKENSNCVPFSTNVQTDTIGPIGAIKSDDYKLYKKQMDENRKLSESIINGESNGMNNNVFNSDMDDRKSSNSNEYNNVFNMDDLGIIGAIKSSDYKCINGSNKNGESCNSNSNSNSRRNSYVIDRFDISEIGAIKTSDYVNKNNGNNNNNNEIDQFASNQYYIDSDDEYYSSLSHCNDITHTDDDDICSVYNGIFDMNNIKQIGSIPENDDININNLQLQNHISEDNQEKIKFKERRESQISNDLMDLMISDDTDYDTDNKYNNNNNKMTVNELLVMFGLFFYSDNNIYDYFNNILGIKYAYECINILPNKIKRPINCYNIKQLMKLNKMIKYISYKVYNNEWIGTYNKQWIGVEYNYIYNIFQYKSKYLMNNNEYYNDENNYKHLYSSNDNIISLQDYDTKYVNINLNSLNNEKEIIYKLTPIQLPNKYKFEPKLFKFGIQTNDKKSLYITDRLIIRQNENYIHSMFTNKFVENYSSIFMKINSTKQCLNISLLHQPNAQNTFDPQNNFHKNFQIKLNQNAQCAKIFITQYNGNGQYIIQKL